MNIVLMAESKNSKIVSNKTGSFRGVEGGVEKLLKAFKKNAEHLNNSPIVKKLKEEETGTGKTKRTRGKVVLYVTSVKAVRTTHERCKQVVQILRGKHVHFTTKDTLLHPDYRKELTERMGNSKNITLPQLFINGDHVGDGEAVMELNETGEFDDLVKHYKDDSCSGTGTTVCELCGGEGFVLCFWCNGSKKGVQNTFNDLKCTVCNKNGLQICPECFSCT